ncbi:MAG: RNA-guided pseudouridylation complex pseudouridine synthase subunit Cbf5 [Thermoplasmata archaeon]|nr:RNA-guided pseudouridylation complex pseudouridine synthase subunit Cbf5 [Thermoplasmata archaeon]
MDDDAEEGISVGPGTAVGATLDGFLLLDKPRGPTSHQVTAWARDLLGVSRAGHGGTLDPNASGILWVGVGSALKLLPLLLEMPKRYVGVVTFHGNVAKKDLLAAATIFTGEVYQTPPVRSAVRRSRRRRRIHRLTILEVEGPRALIDVIVDSGTYVRTLAVDMGDALGVEAHLEELRRVSIGPFDEKGSYTLTQLADAVVAGGEDPAKREALLRPVRDLWREFPILQLKPGAAAAVAHGADLARAGIASMDRPFSRGHSVILVGPNGSLLATGVALFDSKELPKTGWVVDARRVFATPGEYPPNWRPGVSGEPVSPRPS